MVEVGPGLFVNPRNVSSGHKTETGALLMMINGSEVAITPTGDLPLDTWFIHLMRTMK